MTIDGATAVRGPNPSCIVCGGSGVDAAFDSDCTMCWPVRKAGTARLKEHLHPTLGQMIKSHTWDTFTEDNAERRRRRKWQEDTDYFHFKRDHPITMRIVHELVGRKQ